MGLAAPDTSPDPFTPCPLAPHSTEKLSTAQDAATCSRAPAPRPGELLGTAMQETSRVGGYNPGARQGGGRR